MAKLLTHLRRGEITSFAVDHANRRSARRERRRLAERVGGHDGKHTAVQIDNVGRVLSLSRAAVRGAMKLVENPPIRARRTPAQS